MSLKSRIDSVANIGVKPSYEPWEIFLTRKINLVTLIGLFNISLGLICFSAMGNYHFIPECIFVIVASPIVFILNRYKNYIWGTHMFYFIGYFFFFFMNVRMGLDSLMILNFFPFIVSAIQLLGRREMIKHLIVVLSLCLLVVLIIFVAFKHNFLLVKLNGIEATNVKYLNIFISFTVTMSFIASIVIESTKQENLIKGMLREKEVLLAEVFHRVKNNMNIITSLLNLKKNASDSIEVKEALEECRNRIYSMALVHQNIYKTEKFANLDLKEYLHDLMDELLNAHGNNKDVEVFIMCDEIKLDLTQAIPFGLIINELITNSFKYAQIPEKKLRINIEVKKKEAGISLLVKDNGPGIEEKDREKNSLGMELIQSLSEQLNATRIFKNNNGAEFSLSFKS